MTDLHARGVVWEADAFRLVSSAPHCARLLDEFTLSSPNGAAGQHMCLVMPFYGGDVRMLQRASTARFALPLAKRICLHLLRGIARLHERGVVHTDLKGDNIYYETALSDDDIEAWLQRDDGPLPVISEDEAQRATYLLADFGWAQPSNLHPTREISAVALRAPEVYLGAKWDMPADIWSFGCLVYEFLAHSMLFRYEPSGKYGLTETENMLYQMIMYTGELSFRPEQLTASPRALEFFTLDCQLKNLKDPEIMQWPIEAHFLLRQVLPIDEGAAAATFIRRCLRLNPDDRATAAQLLEDEWFDDAA